MSTTTGARGPLAHPRQRNRTWRVQTAEGRDGVAKQYAHLCGEDVHELSKIERRLRSAGLPMPEMIEWSADPPTTIHELVDGQHCTRPTQAMIDDAARVFGLQIKALRRATISWAPRRPAGLPERSRQAAVAAPSTALRNAIVASWRTLSHLARTQPSVTTHGDWRADNLLYLEDRIAAVLDWEILIEMPLGEAVGYAAASLTHSWRPELQTPVDPDLVAHFLQQSEALGVLPTAGAGHARLAAFHAVAVRVVEDASAGIATPTLASIVRHLGARP